MRLPVAILAGGLATRLWPITEGTPKSLVEVAGRPFVEHQLDLLREAGFRDVVLCVGHLGAQVQELLGDGSRLGVQLLYVEDGPELLGTGGALRRALPLLGEAFLVMYGDSYLDCDYRAVEASFLESGKKGLMTVYRNDGQWERSNVGYEAGRVEAYDKNAAAGTFHYVDYGLSALRADVLAGYPTGRKFDLSTVFADLIAGGQMAGYEVADRFYEIGSPAGLAETRRKLTAGGTP
jgi:MurNAc alpha-1-phosphate uridylyltransferase